MCESDRKFCRGCGESLRVSCLSCSADVPVWENFCGDCGGNQKDLVAARRAELDTKREKAESLCSDYAFDKSISIAREIAAIDDDRLQHQKEWAESFLIEVEAEKESEEQNVENHFAEAQTHREAYDYQAAIHAMESIPEAMRTSEISSLLQTIPGEREELQELLRTIEERVKRRDLEGLLEQVNRAVELQPNRADLLKLQGQLGERREKLIKLRDDAYEEAQGLLAQGNSKEAFALVGKVRLQELTPSQEQLKQQLRKMIDAEMALTAVVKEAKSDGAIDPEEVWEMLPKVIGYLKLNANHAAIRQLKADLLARIARDPARHAACASSEMLADLPAEVLTGLPADMLFELPAEVIVTLPPIRNSIGMALKLIPAGEFQMSSLAREPGRENQETQHLVKITQPFYLGVHEVTQDQYEQVMGKNPSDSKGANEPVVNVRWNDAVTFCRKLSDQEGVKYRLPTEAEWEYACSFSLKFLLPVLLLLAQPINLCG